MRPNQRSAVWVALSLILLGAATFAMMVLLSDISLYADDYEYARYFSEGAEAFWAKTVNHYLTWNGRALVHLIAELFLCYETTLYAVLFPLLMAAGLTLGVAMQAGGETKISFPRAVVGGALAMLLVLALPVEYLNQSLCWIAGSFNYCFPVLLLCLFFAVVAAVLRRKQGVALPTLALVLALLAGATTEQVGCCAMLGSAGLILAEIAQQPSSPRKVCICCIPVAALLGYASVMLAPGTSARVVTDAAGSPLAILFDFPRLLERLTTLLANLFGDAAAVPYTVALMLTLAALCALTPGRAGQLLSLGFPAAVAYLLCLDAGQLLLAELIALLDLLLAGVTLLFATERRMTGVLLLCGLLSVGVMLFTTLDAYRTMMPAMLCFILILASLLPELASALSGKVLGSIGLVLLAAVCVVTSLPTFRGYAANHEIIAQNEAAFEGVSPGDTVVLNTDLLPDYKHTVMHESLYFFTQYRALRDVPADCLVLLEGEHYNHYPITLDGVPFTNHAYMRGGAVYLPLDELVAKMGASIVWEWTTGAYYITWNGAPYKLYNEVIANKAGELVVDEAYLTHVLDLTYIEMYAACRFFALDQGFNWVEVPLMRRLSDPQHILIP